MIGLHSSFSAGISDMNKRMHFCCTLLLCVLLILTFSHCSKLRVPASDGNITTHWPQYGRDAQRTHVSPEIISPPLSLIWEYKTNAGIGQSIIAGDGVLYVTTKDGVIIALDDSTGDKIGQRKRRVNRESTCALDQHHLIIARRYDSPTLLLHNLTNNKIIWEDNAGYIASEPLLVRGRVIVTTLWNETVAYDFLSGERIWTFRADDKIYSSPVYAKGLIFFGCSDGKVRAIDEKYGKLHWQYLTNAAVLASGAANKNTLFIGSTDNTMYAFSLESGFLNWAFPAKGKILHAPAVDNKHVIFGSNDHFLYCVDANSGTEQWRFEAGSIISTSPLISGNVVYFGSLDRYLYAVDIRSGEEVWKFKAKGRVRTDPIISNGILFVASEDKYVYAFQHGTIESDE